MIQASSLSVLVFAVGAKSASGSGIVAVVVLSVDWVSWWLRALCCRPCLMFNTSAKVPILVKHH